jgi:hypothetical protein
LEQQQHRQDPGAVAAGHERRDAHEQRPDDRRELAHHVVEAEELAALARRHEAPEQRARQALHAALHEADHDREAEELGDAVEEDAYTVAAL